MRPTFSLGFISACLLASSAICDPQVGAGTESDGNKGNLHKRAIPLLFNRVYPSISASTSTSTSASTSTSTSSSTSPTASPSPVNPAIQGCSKVYVRKNIKNLSDDEWSLMASALSNLQADKTLENLANLHGSIYRDIHDIAMFMPWHTYFIWQFEQAMRKYYPDYAQPYWDAASDWMAPQTADVFRSSRCGGDGDPDISFCVHDGWQSWFIIESGSTPRCLARRFSNRDGTISPFVAPEGVLAYLQSDNFTQFSTSLETGLHFNVHFGIGEEMYSPTSPNDAIFYLHHSNMQRIWDEFRARLPENFMSYGGKSVNDGPKVSPYSGTAKLTDPLPYYTSITVQDVMTPGKIPFCYVYDDMLNTGQTSTTKMAEDSVANLPPKILATYFPDVTPSNTTLKRRSLPDQQKTAKLVVPPPMPVEMINMMGADINFIRGLEAKYAKMVNDLNSAGYRTPFVSG